MSSSGRINDMTYTSLLPPSPFVRPIPIRRIIPLGTPPMDGIISPPLLTVRQDPGLTSTTTKSDVHQLFTFYSAASPKGATYKLTTHLYPSAYPRSPYRFGSVPIDITEYERIKAEKNKDFREKMIMDYMVVLEEWANGVNYGLEDGCENMENYESICASQKRVMWNSVNRIVRNDPESDAADLNRERLTLFLAHPIGYPKETWEPTIRSLLSQLEESDPKDNSNDSTPIVEEIWVFEAVQHGDTGLINAGLLPCAYDWLDNVRDILQFLFYYIPDRVERAANGEPIVLPTYLTRLPEITATSRKKEGYNSRIMIAVGHSFGGASVARTAVECPSLFSSLFLVDPTIQPVRGDFEHPSLMPTLKFIRQDPYFQLYLAEQSLQRRNLWKSKEEAYKSLSKSPFFKAWDLDVLATYVQYGIVEEAGVAKLKMSGLHEAIIFLQASAIGELWQLLPQLDSHISLFFVVSGLDRMALGDPDAVREAVWRRPDNVSNIVLPVGHLIQHEVPVELASILKRFLIEKHSSNATPDAQTTIATGVQGDPNSDSEAKANCKSML